MISEQRTYAQAIYHVMICNLTPYIGVFCRRDVRKIHLINDKWWKQTDKYHLRRNHPILTYSYLMLKWCQYICCEQGYELMSAWRGTSKDNLFFPVFDKYHTEYEFYKIVIIIIVKLRTFPRKQYQNGIATWMFIHQVRPLLLSSFSKCNFWKSTSTCILFNSGNITKMTVMQFIL